MQPPTNRPTANDPFCRGALAVLDLAASLVLRLLRGRGVHSNEGYDGAADSPRDRIAWLQLLLLVTRWTFKINADMGDSGESSRAMERFRLAKQALAEEEGRVLTVNGGPGDPHAGAA
jgi:hypothetical protein